MQYVLINHSPLARMYTMMQAASLISTPRSHIIDWSIQLASCTLLAWLILATPSCEDPDFVLGLTYLTYGGLEYIISKTSWRFKVASLSGRGNNRLELTDVCAAGSQIDPC